MITLYVLRILLNLLEYKMFKCSMSFYIFDVCVKVSEMLKYPAEPEGEKRDCLL